MVDALAIRVPEEVYFTEFVLKPLGDSLAGSQLIFCQGIAVLSSMRQVNPPSSRCIGDERTEWGHSIKGGQGVNRTCSPHRQVLRVVACSFAGKQPMALHFRPQSAARQAEPFGGLHLIAAALGQHQSQKFAVKQVVQMLVQVGLA